MLYDDYDEYDDRDDYNEEEDSTISVEAEDSFVFYVKTNKSPEEIMSLIQSVPEEDIWLDKEYLEAERISDDYIEVWSGITDSIAFTAKFRGGEWYDTDLGRVFDKPGAEYFEISDISEVVSTIRKALGDAVSDIKLSSDPMNIGLSIVYKGPYGESSLYPSSMDAKDDRFFNKFKKDFLKLGDNNIYLENEKELLEAAKHEKEME